MICCFDPITRQQAFIQPRKKSGALGKIICSSISPGLAATYVYFYQRWSCLWLKFKKYLVVKATLCYKFTGKTSKWTRMIFEGTSTKTACIYKGQFIDWNLTTETFNSAPCLLVQRTFVHSNPSLAFTET